MHRNFASMPPRPLPPPGVSYDGRSQTSKFWGPKSHKVIMCPPGELPGAIPERPQRKRPRAWWRGPAPAAAAGPAPAAAAGPAPAPAGGPAPSDDTFLSLPNLEPGGPDAPMPGAPALGAQYYNTTPRRRPKAVKAARARHDFDIFDLDEELLADFVAPPPPCHPPKPQGE